jgi:hypothetical protein
MTIKYTGEPLCNGRNVPLVNSQSGKALHFCGLSVRLTADRCSYDNQVAPALPISLTISVRFDRQQEHIRTLVLYPAWGVGPRHRIQPKKEREDFSTYTIRTILNKVELADETFTNHIYLILSVH